MKNSKLPMILLPIVVLALVWALPFRMMQDSTKTAKADAASRKNNVAVLEKKVASAEQAKANEKVLLGQLKEIRAVLPNTPDEYIIPVINTLSDTAAKHNIRFKSQDQQSPIPAVASSTDTKAAPAAGAPADQKNATPKPLSGTIKIDAFGTVGDFTAFLKDIPATQRLFVEHVNIKSVGTDFSSDPGSQIEAVVDFKIYAAQAATAYAPGS